MKMKQINCFNMNVRFWVFTGIWPKNNFNSRFYNMYSKMFVGTFIVIYNLLFTVNFYFIEKNLDSVIEEMIFYFTELASTSKVFTYLFFYEDLVKILSILESDMFQPITVSGSLIVENAKKLNILYWKIVTGVSVTCNIAHVFIPVIAHIISGQELDLPVCSYSFLSETFRKSYIYPLYFYQSAGIHITMWYNVNIDTFILGVMILTVAQLDILDENLRNITEDEELDLENTYVSVSENEKSYLEKFNNCIIHFDGVIKYCRLLQRVFSFTLFVQFSMAAYIICVCLFRFTLPAPLQYYVFLATYMTCMILQVLVPCWFGTQIIDKSAHLANAIYDCDWTSRSSSFKSNMKFFVMRAGRSLYISGWKMFPLSLKTFTAIMNSAYSVFALLRHMQARQ